MISVARCLRNRMDNNIKKKITITVCEYAHYIAIQIVRSAKKNLINIFVPWKTKKVLCLSNDCRLTEYSTDLTVMFRNRLIGCNALRRAEECENTSTRDRGKWSDSCCESFILEEAISCILRIGDWTVPQPAWSFHNSKKFFAPTGSRRAIPRSFQPVFQSLYRQSYPCFFSYVINFCKYFEFMSIGSSHVLYCTYLYFLILMFPVIKDGGLAFMFH